MESMRELEEVLRRLVTLLSDPEAKQWRKRVEKYVGQIASGNVSGTSDFLAMYQGGMGSFLDLQGSSVDSHQELSSLRDRAYNLAREVVK
ncbi:hypothetical protein MNQ95_00170 [Pseudoxanthomonas daejeonensis]|uniref:DUF6966 domain-containing protein n=1 Tax=Pseudoxanthomonas daejeonensis TaxID=266062 RepID=UPI001F5460C5|nr:hypothetical protein [Pseudoxanthomonas daejeonensis]UNK57579.1 hypothetical protein MNQ95_00170 [Pseudoxanthomonas daejeonensis]